MSELKFDVHKVEMYVNRGFSKGFGDPEGQVCVEAALCLALGLPMGDDPPCTDRHLRNFKVFLNDQDWHNASSRASGMRDLLYAQIGTRGQLDAGKWADKLYHLTVLSLTEAVLDSLCLQFPGPLLMPVDPQEYRYYLEAQWQQVQDLQARINYRNFSASPTYLWELASASAVFFHLTKPGLSAASKAKCCVRAAGAWAKHASDSPLEGLAQNALAALREQGFTEHSWVDTTWGQGKPYITHIWSDLDEATLCGKSELPLWEATTKSKEADCERCLKSAQFDPK